MSADNKTTHNDRADSAGQLSDSTAIESKATAAESKSGFSRWWIVELFLAHMVALLTLIPFIEPGNTPWVILFVGLIFSQTSLLGFWAALGTNPFWQRVTGLVLGTAYLAFVMQFTFREPELIVMVTISVLFVAGPLYAVRFWRGTLQHVGQVEVSERQEALQFSIRNLLVLTLAVACTVTLFKFVTPVFNQWAAILSFSLAFVVVGLCGSWSMLGTRHLALRAIAAIGLCVLTGWALGEFMGGPSGATCILMTTLQGGLFIGSLWIVRRAGYRLLRHDFSAGQESSSTITVSESSKPA